MSPSPTRQRSREEAWQKAFPESGRDFQRKRHSAVVDSPSSDLNSRLVEQLAVNAALEGRIQALESELTKTKRALKEKTNTMKEQSLSIYSNSRSNHELERELDRVSHLQAQTESINELNRDLSDELLMLKQQVKDTSSLSAQVDALEDIVDRLENDNARLLRLLSTAGSSLYREVIQEFEDADGCAYVPHSGGDSPSRIRPTSGATGIVGVANMYAQKGHHLKPVNAADEGKNWVPLATYVLAAEFKRAHPHVEMDAMLEFLGLINQVWRRRETRRTERLQQKWRKRVGEMRRQANHRVPFQEVLQSHEITRLKQELARTVAKGGPGGRPHADEAHKFLSGAMNTVRQLSDKVESYSSQHLRKHELAGEMNSLENMTGPLVAYLGRCTVEMLDTFGQEMDKDADASRARMLRVPRHDGDFYTKMLRLYNSFVERQKRSISSLRRTVREVIERAVDQAVDHKLGKAQGKGSKHGGYTTEHDSADELFHSDWSDHD
ncbi:hypothetical protein CYMTET_20851 [Cymbomonas tetramitiformis]|uniref:Uncharacterized protein n=1 Tax=Cymbomonas tetramitiformis TaxID=36881 RepID=A0AAE0G389_9CHLO|nr:hypothetical protein CYMTET_20851 [Cymbomonas tetramitiformis]